MTQAEKALTWTQTCDCTLQFYSNTWLTNFDSQHKQGRV